jgi:putative DNA primase/helicase
LARDLQGATTAVQQRAEALIEELLARTTEVTGELRRVARRFALIAASGELAQRALQLPWPGDEVFRAILICFDAWLDARGGAGPSEIISARDAIRAAIERHGESRFRDLNSEWTRDGVRDLLGYRFRDAEGRLVYGFTTTGWRDILRPVANPASVAKILAAEGVLLTNSKGEAPPRLVKTIDGMSKALYAVRGDSI